MENGIRRDDGEMIKWICLVLTAIFLTGCGAGGTQTEKEKDEGYQSLDQEPSGNKNEGDHDDDGQQEDNTYRQISMEQAIAIMEEESGYIILDVRRPDEDAAGHIPGAINVANESIGSSEIEALPDKDQLIMVYCRSGRRSKEAAEKLAALGYTNIVEFGGILDWKGDIET